jgi:predicted HTH domain antitoxin
MTEIEHDVRLSYALWLFKNAKVTISKAAELAELNIYEFISACKKNDVAVIDMSKEELLEDLAGINLK